MGSRCTLRSLCALPLHLRPRNKRLHNRQAWGQVVPHDWPCPLRAGQLHAPLCREQSPALHSDADHCAYGNFNRRPCSRVGHKEAHQGKREAISVQHLLRRNDPGCLLRRPGCRLDQARLQTHISDLPPYQPGDRQRRREGARILLLAHNTIRGSLHPPHNGNGPALLPSRSRAKIR